LEIFFSFQGVHDVVSSIDLFTRLLENEGWVVYDGDIKKLYFIKWQFCPKNSIHTVKIISLFDGLF